MAVDIASLRKEKSISKASGWYLPERALGASGKRLPAQRQKAYPARVIMFEEMAFTGGKPCAMMKYMNKDVGCARRQPPVIRHDEF